MLDKLSTTVSISTSKLELFPFSKLNEVQPFKSHHYWTRWPALDKGRLLKSSTASTRESENSVPGLWPPSLLRRLTWVAAETMRLSTHSETTKYTHFKYCCNKTVFIFRVNVFVAFISSKVLTLIPPKKVLHTLLFCTNIKLAGVFVYCPNHLNDFNNNTTLANLQ